MSELAVEPLWGIGDLAKVLGVSKQTLYKYRSRGDYDLMPPAFTVGRQPRWKPSTVRKWIDEQEAQGEQN